MSNLRLQSRIGRNEVTVAVWSETARQWFGHTLSVDETLHFAGQLVCMASMVGEATGSPFSELLQAFRDRLSTLMDQLGSTGLAKEGESCPVCYRVIFNKANMARHLATHKPIT